MSIVSCFRVSCAGLPRSGCGANASQRNSTHALKCCQNHPKKMKKSPMLGLLEVGFRWHFRAKTLLGRSWGSWGALWCFKVLRDTKMTSKMVPGTPKIDKKTTKNTKNSIPSKHYGTDRKTKEKKWAELPPGTLPHPEGPDLAPGRAWGYNVNEKSALTP